ncbi:PEP-CTERM sorting domain-containing protein [Akkermansiaceae bacterium]|nr:PEP-CTERM sorting domain-containing protein [Akkermansiaceae bacterium]
MKQTHQHIGGRNSAKHLLAAATFVGCSLISISADAATTLSASSVASTASSLDLETTYDDWARWAAGNRPSELYTTATSEKAATSIINTTLNVLSGSGPSNNLAAIHSYVQESGSTIGYALIRHSSNAPNPVTDPSLELSFSLLANTDYSIDIYTAVTGDRSDQRFTANVAGATQSIYTISSPQGSGTTTVGHIYTLDVAGLTADGTLTIKMDTTGGLTTNGHRTVKLSAIGVTATPIPEPSSLALLGLGGLLLVRRRRA